MNKLNIKEVHTKKDLRDFIYLPEKVHKNNKNWLPPLYIDEWNFFNPEKNKSFQQADTVMYIAYRGNIPVGRIMGIIHRLYNKIHNEDYGRFSFMECYEDQEIAHALLQKVEEWAKEKGMVKLIGPLGFSDKDPQGFQIEGFEYPQFIASPNNEPYLPEMVEKEGYIKKIDLVNYFVQMPEKLPEVYNRISRIKKNTSFSLVEFKSKKELKPYVVPALEVMNQTYMDIYGYVPLDDEEKKELAARYFPILDPHFVKMVEHNNEVVAFMVGIPDPSAGIIKAKGRLLPFGFIHILKESKNSKSLLMLLGAIKKEFREQGLDVMMITKMYESAIRYKMQTVNSHLILETNKRTRHEFERVGGKVSKVFRIYQKDI